MHTAFLQLLEDFVVLSAQLGPLGELVLAACGVELFAELEELGLQLFLLGGGFGGRGWEAVEEVPKLGFVLERGMYMMCVGDG